MSVLPKLSAFDRDPRRDVAIQGIIRIGDERFEVVIHDISVSGFSASLDVAIADGTRVSFSTASLGTHETEAVWSHGDMHGFRLIRPLSGIAVEEARQVDNIAVVGFGRRGSVEDPGLEAAKSPVKKWPIAWRVAFIAGSAAGLWAIIGLCIFA